MPSLTIAGLSYITASYLLRGWQERLTERNLPKYLRSQLSGSPIQRFAMPTQRTITVRIKASNVTLVEREIPC